MFQPDPPFSRAGFTCDFNQHVVPLLVMPWQLGVLRHCALQLVMSFVVVMSLPAAMYCPGASVQGMRAAVTTRLGR